MQMPGYFGASDTARAKNELMPFATGADLARVGNNVVKRVVKMHSVSSWPDLFRPSTSWLGRKQDVDARDKRGHDAGRQVPRGFARRVGGAAIGSSGQGCLG